MPATAVKRQTPPRKSAPLRPVARRVEALETDEEYAARHPIESAIEAKKKREGRIGDTDEEIFAIVSERSANCRPQDLIPADKDFIERLRKPWPKR